MSGDGGEAATVASRTADSTSIDSAARLLRTVVLSLSLSSFTCASLEPARGVFVCLIMNSNASTLLCYSTQRLRARLSLHSITLACEQAYGAAKQF